MIADYSSALATVNPTITIKDEDGVEVKGEVVEGEKEVKREEGAGRGQRIAANISAGLPAGIRTRGEDVSFLMFEEILANHPRNLPELRDYAYILRKIFYTADDKQLQAALGIVGGISLWRHPKWLMSAEFWHCFLDALGEEIRSLKRDHERFLLLYATLKANALKANGEVYAETGGGNGDPPPVFSSEAYQLPEQAQQSASSSTSADPPPVFSSALASSASSSSSSAPTAAVGQKRKRMEYGIPVDDLEECESDEEEDEEEGDEEENEDEEEEGVEKDVEMTSTVEEEQQKIFQMATEKNTYAIVLLKNKLFTKLSRNGLVSRSTPLDLIFKCDEEE
uniref:Uncharacterized protein n=1 Tax=Chromera velia CCMP2878 TaxID=1169474 RepID=A0A0G4G5S4_9ALVE|eukprot:Cvel_20383.t1-p1 / transcript=Cvel_20383.t1 / gene=Cvel_20383 / organism=Chromera_velia_CCMP2878 / gene_product=hypothetical protein / transcript_product=hypothetical protein / location=Cvel_scaffold1824:13243-20019(+) / protein_length=337 / sequence_SO=supercontig / SO=protein_coding / is_pseudo=false